jgi:cytochrome c553
MRRAGVAGIVIVLAALQTSAQERGARALPPAANRTIEFAADVQPILERSCARCHARGRTRGGFSIESREMLLKGGDNGPAIVLGRSDESELVALVAGLDPENVMPQKGSRLTDEQIGILRAWIDQGASWTAGVSFARAAPRNLEPRRPAVASTDGGVHPIDRLLAPYYAAHNIPPSSPAGDRALIRRMYLDVVGQLPAPDAVRAFVADVRADKRTRLVQQLLADRVGYAEHWLTFWNDLLRNDYRGTGYIDGGREQITAWLYSSLVTNVPFDRFVAQLVDPVPGSAGFSKGIVWRGVVNASQTPEMQAAQNISQVFMGVNLKCASCHDSFVNDWQLSDAYGMASIYADQPLQMVECDKPTGETAKVKFLYSQVAAIDPAAPKAQRLKQLATALTGERNGRLSRTFVNRVWARLMGRGLVEPVDDMEREAWHPDLLDWLAEDFVVSGYNARALLERILTSDAYQRAAVDLPDRVDAYTFQGPAVRRLTAEQFVDALGAVTGVWQATPAGDFDFTVAGSDGAPAARGLWIQAPRGRARSRANAGSSAAPLNIASRFSGTAPAASAANRTAAISIAPRTDEGTKAAQSPWFARGRFSLDVQPATAHVLVAADRSYVLYVNGEKVTEQKKPAAARLVDVGAHVQRGDNVIAVAVGLPAADADESPAPAAATAAGDGLFTQVLIRRRFAASAPIETADIPRRAWRVSPAAEDGWERQAFEDAAWALASARAARTSDSASSHLAIARALATAGRVGRTRAALTVADPLTTALGRPSREQVVTSRSTPATTLQALELLNGGTLAEYIARAAGELMAESAGSPAAMVDLVYLRALGRAPTEDEARTCGAMLGTRLERAGVEDLLWAIAMLPEFQLID